MSIVEAKYRGAGSEGCACMQVQGGAHVGAHFQSCGTPAACETSWNGFGNIGNDSKKREKNASMGTLETYKFMKNDANLQNLGKQ